MDAAASSVSNNAVSPLDVPVTAEEPLEGASEDVWHATRISTLNANSTSLIGFSNRVRTVSPPQRRHYLAVGFDGAVYVLLGVDSGRVVFPAALEHSALQSGVQPGQHGAAASQVVAVVGHRAVGKAESEFSSSNQMVT